MTSRRKLQDRKECKPKFSINANVLKTKSLAYAEIKDVV